MNINVSRYAAKLQRLYDTMTMADKEYKYYYALRRDENGNVNKTPFVASHEKSALARFRRAEKEISAMEASYKLRYEDFNSWKKAKDFAESKVRMLEIELTEIRKVHAELFHNLLIEKSEAMKRTYAVQFETASKDVERLKKDLRMYDGQLKKLNLRNPQELPTLEELKNTAPLSKTSGFSNKTTKQKLDEAAKAIQAAEEFRKNNTHLMDTPDGLDILESLTISTGEAGGEK